MNSYFPSEEFPLLPDEIDLNHIFIGREEQIDQFNYYLDRWIRLSETSTYLRINKAPSTNDKIQGMVVLLHGRGGIGKTTLLRYYHNIASEYQQELFVSKIVDWEFAAQDKRTLFNPAPREEVDSFEYFNLLRNQLADALDKNIDDFREYQVAAKAVEDARKLATGVFDSLKQDSRYTWLGGFASEVVLNLVRLKAPVSNVVLSNQEIAQKAKEVIGAGVQIGAEHIEMLWNKLHDKLDTKLDNFLEPALKLGLSLGYDLASFTEERPLIIFFDTYEEVDEADEFLRLVIGASGVRVGWVLAGRDNLWAGQTQRLRSQDTEYGYKDIVKPDRRFAIDFSASGVGNFSLSDIKEFFDLLCAIRRQPPLPHISEKEAAHILDITQGVPLAVKIAAGLYLEKSDVKAFSEDVGSQREIVDQMVRRYLLHTRTNQGDRAILYGLALLRRSDQPIAIAATLNLSPSDRYEAELSRLHRRYGFIFNRNEQPSLHQEVRHFLRLWLLEHRIEPSVVAINQRILDAHKQAFKELEERRQYISLRERMKDDQWIGIYLDLCEQQFWLDPADGVKLVLPFMMAASIYRREANREVAKIGGFFKYAISQPHCLYWNWAVQSLVFTTSNNPLPEEFDGLEELVKLARQNCPHFFPPIPDYQWELEAALWWRLGEAYRGRNEDRALIWYKNALERLDQVSELEADIDVYWGSDYENNLEKKLNESKILLDQAFEVKSDSVTAYLYQARASASRGIAYKDFTMYQRAIEDYNRMIELKPKDAIAFANLGITYYNLKEFQRAIEKFDQSLKLKPKLACGYSNRGVAYASLKDFQRAVVDFNRAIKLNPKEAEFYNNRGVAYFGLREYQRAVVDFNRAIKLNPNYARAYYNRGLAYEYLMDFQRAIEDLDRAIKLDPKYAWAYKNRGDTYESLKEYQRAVVDYDRAIELNPKEAEFYNNRGVAYFGLREYQRAVVDFNRAIKLNPNYARAYYNRGLAYEYLKDFQRAIEDLNCAVKLEPSDEAIQAKQLRVSPNLTSPLQQITFAPLRFLDPLGISRREVLVMIGLGLAGAGIIGGIAWWHYLNTSRTSSPPFLSLPGDLLFNYHKHSDNVVGVAWSPDGTRIASASYDHTVQVWDAANGSHNYTYRGHNQRVTCVAWSPDGTRIASGSDDHTVQVWNAANGHLIYTYRGHTNNVHTLSWSPDSTLIASAGSDQTVRVWYALEGSTVLIYNARSYVWTVAWSPDGTRIASGHSDTTVQVWDSHNGKLLLTYRQHSSRLHHLDWSPDGTRIASGGDDYSVQVWDAHNGKQLLDYLGHTNNVWTMAWSLDGTLIASGGVDTTVQVWDAHNGSVLFIYHNHHAGVASVAWSPDGTRIASGSWDHTVQVWVAPTLEKEHPYLN